MTREFSDELLSAYLDDQLSAEERALVEAQLAANPEQRQLLDELRILSGQVQSLPPVRADDRFADRVVQAALAAQGHPGKVAPATRGKSPGTRFWSFSLAAVAATAACVGLIVWRSSTTDGPGGNSIVVTQPAEPTDVQQALANLRAAAPAEGQAIVLRIRVGQGLAPHQVLDAALQEVGIPHRDPAGASEAVGIGGNYRRYVAEKYGGMQPGVVNEALNAATHSPEDAVYLDADWLRLEETIAALAERSPEKLVVEPLAKVAIPRLAFPENPGGDKPEAEATDLPAAVKPAAVPETFSQRLNPRLYKIENAPAANTDIPAPATAPKVDGKKRVRVLILVERD